MLGAEVGTWEGHERDIELASTASPPFLCESFHSLGHCGKGVGPGGMEGGDGVVATPPPSLFIGCY